MAERAERRVEILAAARRLFATKGYHETKVEDIAAEAGIAKGTFYLYFRDKRAAFVELVDTLFAQIEARIVAIDPARPIAPQVASEIRAVLDVLLDAPETTQILMSHAVGLDPTFAEKIRSFYATVKQLLVESLEEGQRLGIVAPGDAALFGTFTLGALKEILLEMTASATPPPRDKVAAALFGILAQGYLRIEGVARPEPASVSPAPAPRAGRAAARGRSRR